MQHSAKQEAQIILSQAPKRLCIAADRSLKHCLLLILQLQDPLLDGASHHKARRADCLVLRGVAIVW